MKHKYLYQGWAGNTYSHKCNSQNSSYQYFKLKKDIATNSGEAMALELLLVLTSEALVKTSNTCTSNILGMMTVSGDIIYKDVLRAIKVSLPCFCLTQAVTVPPVNSLQEALKNMGENISENIDALEKILDTTLEEITETEYNSIRDNMIKELEEELKG